MGKATIATVLLLIVVFLALSEAKRGFWNGFMNGRPLRDHYARLVVGEEAAANCDTNPGMYNVIVKNHTQKLDHFDPSNTNTWQQQYQYRDTFFKSNPDGDVIFLLVGGEGPAPLTWMCYTNYTWTQLAQKHNAFMFQLEHRYFGTSAPTSDMSVANLKWLTTEQALADLNEWIPAMNKQFNFTKPKWVAFGGSYPGTIAALMRVVYPNITNGNIASSAPLWPKVDFWEYAVKMEEAIQWESTVNASNAMCYNNTRDAFAYIRSAVYTEEGRTELNSMFNILPRLNYSNTMDFDATYFLTGMYNTFQGIIQYTFDDRNSQTTNRSGLNIVNLCNYMVQPNKNHTQRLLDVYQWNAAWSGGDPDSVDNDYWGDMTFVQNTSFLSYGAAYRGWMWLSCQEFGWLQTTDNGYGIFSNSIPLSFYLQYCTDSFDKTVTNDFMRNGVYSTLGRYGLPQNYNGSNVVLPNGSLDPWSTLGCNTSDISVNRYARTTVGGSHCVDMYPYNVTNPNQNVESSDVVNTIKLVTDQVAFYVNLTGPFGGSSYEENYKEKHVVLRSDRK